MRRSTTRLAMAGSLALAAGLATAGTAAPAPDVRLGPLLRVQTPGDTIACPFESEPEIARTSAGTWVAYNDDTGCPLVASQLRLTGVQLLSRDGKRRYFQLPKAWTDFGYYAGDPDLAPDPSGNGGVLLSSLVSTGEVRVVQISPDGRTRLLPSPSVSKADDKEFLATDSGRRSRFRGSTYLVWDDIGSGRITFRAFDGRRWREAVKLGDVTSQPDVAVAPNGDVAVAYATEAGVAARISYDGGRTFSAPQTVLRGAGPGRNDPSCPLRPTIAQRQRATKSARAAFDTAGRLHVVAALGAAGPFGLSTSAGAGTGGDGRILHTESADRGRTFSRPVTVGDAETAEVQWAPAIAALPRGGIAVSYLQTAETTSYDALVAVRRAGRFQRPVVLSQGHGQLPPAQEAVGNSNCYGIGDYTGLASTPDGVVATWPTTVDVRTSFVDSDIAVREVHLHP
jgi:hypothetical protein